MSRLVNAVWGEFTGLDVLITQQDTYSTEIKVQDKEGKKSKRGPPSLARRESNIARYCSCGSNGPIRFVIVLIDAGGLSVNSLQADQ